MKVLPFLLFILSHVAVAEGITHVTATRDSIVLDGIADHAVLISELQPSERQGAGTAVANVSPGPFQISIPRLDVSRDRIYSAYAMPGSTRFVDTIRDLDRLDESYPVTDSKKGLQVADVPDAISLGIRHAGLNVYLNTFIDVHEKPDSFTFSMDGKTFRFKRTAVERLDQHVKALSDAGVNVYFILVYQISGDAALDKLMLHPNYDRSTPNGISAFNVSTPQSVEELKASFEFLAQRYSRADRKYGRAMNYIVGNEVDSHWYWYNLGHADVDTVATQYAIAVRLCHTAVRKYNASARVFISLDHFWNMHYSDASETQCCQGRQLLEKLHEEIAAHGDFDWGIAYHPYPENLFEPRFWLDKTATFRDDTPRITFKNVEMLPRYLRRSDLCFDGHPRRVILSEQGFHTPDGKNGQALQAAAFALAYYKIDRIAGIDAFILHRQIDNAQEGGLHLGLWSERQVKKKIYEVFRAAGTKNWHTAFDFALPIIGIKDWNEANPRFQ